MSPLIIEAVDVVKIWGKWCGPNWPAGQKIPAKDYDWEKDPDPSVRDDLDAACKRHDFVYGTQGTKAQANADKLLEKEARRIRSELKRKGKGGSKKAIAANRVITGMYFKRKWS